MARGIKEVIMDRDGITSEQADALIQAAKDDLQTYLEAGDMEGAEDICMEHFGLEPDYIFDILDY